MITWQKVRVVLSKKSPSFHIVIFWLIINSCSGTVWAGGTQLFERAHLTDGNTCFCRESSKLPNESYCDLPQMGPLQTKILTQMCPFIFWDLNQLNLIYTILAHIQLCGDYRGLYYFQNSSFL